MYTIEARSADGDTVRAQLDKAPDGLLANVTPQEIRDALRDMLKAHQMVTDAPTIKRFFDEPTQTTKPTHTRKVA